MLALTGDIVFIFILSFSFQNEISSANELVIQISYRNHHLVEYDIELLWTVIKFACDLIFYKREKNTRICCISRWPNSLFDFKFATCGSFVFHVQHLCGKLIVFAIHINHTLNCFFFFNLFVGFFMRPRIWCRIPITATHKQPKNNPCMDLHIVIESYRVNQFKNRIFRRSVSANR